MKKIDKCKKLVMNNYKNLVVLELGANDAIINLQLGYISLSGHVANTKLTRDKISLGVNTLVVSGRLTLE